MRIAYSAAIAALVFVTSVSAQGWGTIKGQIVWGDPNLPAQEKINVDKDQQHCLGKGPLIKSDLIVDAKTKGVKNVMVWLAPATPGSKVAIHPSMTAVPNQKIVIDQPQCQFEPRITMMRAGQSLEVKNSAPIAHNARVSGRNELNGTVNINLPNGGALVLEGKKALVAEPRPLMLACDIHPWMGGRIAVFDHPYFAVTKEDGTFEIKNAPAGNYIIFVQHEKAGWLHQGGTSKGQPITIPANGTLNLGPYQLKPDQLK